MFAALELHTKCRIPTYRNCTNTPQSFSEGVSSRASQRRGEGRRATAYKIRMDSSLEFSELLSQVFRYLSRPLFGTIAAWGGFMSLTS